MLHHALIACVLALPALGAAAPPQTRPATAPATRPALVGQWLGTLQAGPARLRVVFHISAGAGGALAGTLDSIDQGLKGIPLSAVIATEGGVRFECAVLMGTFRGTLVGDVLDGQWSQGTVTLPLTLARVERVPELNRPQTPRPPYPYREELVAFDNPAAPGVRLGATLTWPAGAGPFPAVVLLPGSGPQTRDEVVFGHAIFHVLADHLTRRGIAVLRADKRGVGASSGDFAKATTADLASDARAAIAFLKGRPQIDAQRIGLLGHSEGGAAAPMAAGAADVAFVVLLAAPGVVGHELIVEQRRLIGRSAGVPEAQVARSTAVFARLVDAVRTEPDDAKAQAKMREIVGDALKDLTPAERGAAGDADAATAGMKFLTTPWFRYFLTLDPAPHLAKVTCPVLAINGEKDTQVGPLQNLPPIEAALKAAGNRGVTAQVIPGVNHLFQTCTTGSPAEYVTIEETISPKVLTLIADWIAARTNLSAPRATTVP